MEDSLITMSELINKVVAACGVKPLIKKGALNLFMDMPCHLKMVTKMAIDEFVELYNASHDTLIHSPWLIDGDFKGIEIYLKFAQTEEDLPDVLVVSSLQTVLSRRFRETFIDTDIYTGITSDDALKTIPEMFSNPLRQSNIGIYAAGYWSVICDLSIKPPYVPCPNRWSDLVDPLYKNLITVPGYKGSTSIAMLLMLMKEQFGSSAATDFAANIRNIWDLDVIVKSLDSNEPRRTPFNLVPSAATIQLPPQKRAAVLEFEDGPLLAPMHLFVKTSRIEECRPIINYFHSNIMQNALNCGDFDLAGRVNWEKPFSFPSWEYLLNNDFEELTTMLDAELQKGLRSDVFQTC